MDDKQLEVLARIKNQIRYLLAEGKTEQVKELKKQLREMIIEFTREG